MASANPEVDAALDVLRNAGHNVGQASNRGGEIFIAVDGVPRTYEQILEWAIDVSNRRPGELTGKYVRLLMAPNTRMGTLGKCETKDGRQRYILHFDQRFRVLPIKDMWVYPDEVEECQRLTDAVVEGINRLAEHGQVP